MLYSLRHRRKTRLINRRIKSSDKVSYSGVAAGVYNISYLAYHRQNTAALCNNLCSSRWAPLSNNNDDLFLSRNQQRLQACSLFFASVFSLTGVAAAHAWQHISSLFWPRALAANVAAIFSDISAFLSSRIFARISSASHVAWRNQYRM